MRDLASLIWSAGVASIESRALVHRQICDGPELLQIADQQFEHEKIGKIWIVGAGKAAKGMAEGAVESLSHSRWEGRVSGWVNVPADCVPEQPLGEIVCHPARPAGINEPTLEGVQGTEKILQIARSAQPEDLLLVLISGGGSALLPAPRPPISLDQKRMVARELARKGASIDELNAVRRELSGIKGGGLARASRAGTTITLIISDVIGDPLETIASGPTFLADPRPDVALEILKSYLGDDIPGAVSEMLESAIEEYQKSEAAPDVHGKLINRIIGSNSIAIDAATQKAEELGFQVTSFGSENAGPAADLARKIIDQAEKVSLENPDQKHCLLFGGETTVDLSAAAKIGKGGRNQEVAVVATVELENYLELRSRITLLAAGTDGEDGPTDAAGGFADAQLFDAFQKHPDEVKQALESHDTYPLLQQDGGLFQTGPTQTNVMDLTVVLVAESSSRTGPITPIASAFFQ